MENIRVENVATQDYAKNVQWYTLNLNIVLADKHRLNLQLSVERSPPNATILVTRKWIVGIHVNNCAIMENVVVMKKYLLNVNVGNKTLRRLVEERPYVWINVRISYNVVINVWSNAIREVAKKQIGMDVKRGVIRRDLTVVTNANKFVTWIKSVKISLVRQKSW